MSRVKHIHIGADVHFSDLWVHYERYAWLAIAAILMAGFAGILQRGGPLVHRSLSGPSGSLVPHHDVVAGNASPTHVEFSIGQAGMGQPLRIRFNRDQRSGVRGVAQQSASAPTSDIPNVTVTENTDGPRTLWYRISLQGGPSIQFRKSALP